MTQIFKCDEPGCNSYDTTLLPLNGKHYCDKHWFPNARKIILGIATVAVIFFAVYFYQYRPATAKKLVKIEQIKS